MRRHHQITISFTIPLLIIALGAAYPLSAHALAVKVVSTIQFPKDIIIAIKDALTALNTAYLQLKESALDKVAWMTSKIQLAQEATKIVSQIQQGFPESLGPLFIENWENYSARARNNATSFFLNELNKTSTLDPAFRDTIRRSFNTNPYGNQSVFNRLRPTFEDDVSGYPGCEYGGCDIRSFQNDFSKGGWLGFQSLTNNPAHNPFAAYNMLQQDLTERVSRAEQAALDEARSSLGFLGTRDCPPEQPPEEFVGPPAPELIGPPEPPQPPSILGTLNIARCRITRPGASIQQDISEAFGSLHQTLANVDEIFEIIGSLQSIVGSTRESGFGRSTGALQRSRGIIRAEESSTAIEEEDRLIAKANALMFSIYDIWTAKKRALNANVELKAELEKIVANRISCESHGQHDISNDAEFDLFDVRSRESALGKEVGIGNSIGDFAVGGAHSINLAEKLADVQFLVAIIKNPGVIPNYSVSQKLRNAFNNLLDPDDSLERLREAKQRLGGAAAELETAMMPFEGAGQQANGELRQIQSQIIQAKSDQRACGIL